MILYLIVGLSCSRWYVFEILYDYTYCTILTVSSWGVTRYALSPCKPYVQVSLLSVIKIKFTYSCCQASGTGG
jgi:hypothetical protein